MFVCVLRFFVLGIPPPPPPRRTPATGPNGSTPLSAQPYSPAQPPSALALSAPVSTSSSTSPFISPSSTFVHSQSPYVQQQQNNMQTVSLSSSSSASLSPSLLPAATPSSTLLVPSRAVRACFLPFGRVRERWGWVRQIVGERKETVLVRRHFRTHVHLAGHRGGVGRYG